MFARREEISIMKMVGATNGFIRAPFVIEGTALGLMGGLLAFFAEWGVYNYITEKLVASSGIFTMVGFEQIWAGLLPILVVTAMIIGVIGSTWTIRKFLKV